MQEEVEQEGTGRKSSLISVSVGAAILCLIAGVIAGAVLLGTTADSPLPTAAARATVGFSPALGIGPGSSSDSTEPVPVPMASLVPQSGGRSAGDPYIPNLGNTGYDVQRYTLQLALDPADAHVEGTTVIEATSTLSGLSQLSLDFIGFQVSSVTANGRAAEFHRDGEKLVVDLPSLVPDGAPLVLTVVYRGEPLQEPSTYLRSIEHLGLYRPDDESLYVIAEPDGARYWFPANDHPRDKATFRFEIVVPAGFTAVANGQLLETRPGAFPNGELGELFIWEHNRPMAPYLALVAVGHYQRLDGRSPGGIPLRHYLFPEMEAELQRATAQANEAIDWMVDMFGPYPFESFGYVTVRQGATAMESQTMVLLSEALIGPKTAVHELAHMWFGDWVSLDSWGEMWRNEGFATYVQLMWETGDDPEELDLRMAGISSVVEGNDKSYPLNNPPPEYLFDLNVYFQGAAAAHALRRDVGDKAFFGGLRLYFQRFGGSTASDAQFQAVMEEASGRSLEAFFAEWFPPG